jgi:uncharacterized membrane protein
MQARAAPLYANSPLYFSALLLIALVGFFPSYYGRIGDARMVHQFHGGVSTLWMLLLIGQGWLVRKRRFDLHRLVGRTSIVLAVLFVISGVMIVHDMLTRDGGFARMFGPRLAFIDVSSVLFFVFAYSMAIHYRRTMALHARYMVCTALPLLPPALSRALGHFVLGPNASFGMALHTSFIVAEVIVLALLYHDWRLGKVRAPYLILLALLLAQQASFDYALKFTPWRELVAWMATL